MTTLKDRLKAMIRASGPISVATYMDLCLHDRRHGYYATRPGLGIDFTTAPEISQIFGELLGLWAANAWREMGAPEQVTLIEVGPGRGTLMIDALRAAQTVPGFLQAIDLHFIEPSPVLQTALADRFTDRSPVFLGDLLDAPTTAPILLIANEWLDCLPVQQFIRIGEAWHERVIGLDADGELSFGLNPEPLPAELASQADQAELEIQPGLKTLAATLSKLFDETPGRALLIDYGPSEHAPGDTLRAYQKGAQIDPLAAPGQSDLTCDVDFGRLSRLAAACGLSVETPRSQSQFLLSLGAEQRLNQLARQNPQTADELYAGIRKLVDPAEMGHRFQVLEIARPH